MLKLEDLRGVVEDEIIDHLKILGVKSLIKDGIGSPLLREKARSICDGSKIACVIMSYEIADSLLRVVSDLKQSLTDTSFIVLLSRRVDPANMYLGIMEGQSLLS